MKLYPKIYNTYFLKLHHHNYNHKSFKLGRRKAYHSIFFIIPFLSGSHHCILPMNGTCCNGYRLLENEICCEGHKPCKKRDRNDNECCFNFFTGEGETYKSGHNKRCRGGKVVVDNLLPCGQFTYYTPHHEICCINKSYKRKEGYVRCCGDKGLTQAEECCKKVETWQNFGKKE